MIAADYDHDGDLDLFIGGRVSPGSYPLPPRSYLLRNDALKLSKGGVKFTDVSREAGILIEGYSLGAAISDVNADGWPDIYVCNDFLTNDILYINNGSSLSSNGEHRPARRTIIEGGGDTSPLSTPWRGAGGEVKHTNNGNSSTGRTA